MKQMERHTGIPYTAGRSLFSSCLSTTKFGYDHKIFAVRFCYLVSVLVASKRCSSYFYE